MGGVAGHMDHLYDNRELTFQKMQEIMVAASNGELDAEEKVDGQNLFLSYSIPEGKAKGARNKGNYRSGGLDARALAQKFAGRGGIEKAFNGGFSAFEKAVEALSDEEKLKLFGPENNIWYNAEVMDPGTEGDPGDPGSVNVIKYDNKTLKIHDVGHFLYDKESNSEKPIPKENMQILDNALQRMQNHLHGHDFSLARRAIIQLQKLEDDEALKHALGRLSHALKEANVSPNQTVEDYMFSRILHGVDTDLPMSIRKELARYLLEMPGNMGARELKKLVPKEDLPDLTEVIKSKKMILKQAIEPIELIIHDFTVEILKSLESVFIADNKKEVQRLRQELSTAVNQMIEKGAEDPAAMEILQVHLNKIKDMGNISTPVEAIVFDYDGHTYKFAGNYAPLNQILGMFRYPKGGKKLTSESLNIDMEVVTSKNGKKVALLPGGFKPPHAGHYGLAKLLEDDPDIDEVVIIVGKNPRFSDREPTISITAEQSKDLWDLYTMKDKNINVRIQEGKTPVADVYDLIADKNSFSEGDTVVLGKSDKDVGDTRFGRAQAYAERHNPGVNVEEMVFPTIGGKGMGGRTLRDLIALGDKESFLSKLPPHLNKGEMEEAWNVVSSSINASLDHMIDSTIAEISAMSTGNVSGPSSNGFGRPNTYNPFKKRSKTSKPKVSRPKRQRRR
jgi:hypothetical protein